jgi:hypothetical protein
VEAKEVDANSIKARNGTETSIGQRIAFSINGALVKVS